MKTKLTAKHRAKIAAAYRKAVMHQMELWNAADEIESIVGGDIDSIGDLLEGHAVCLANPQGALNISEDAAVEAVLGYFAQDSDGENE